MSSEIPRARGDDDESQRPEQEVALEGIDISIEAMWRIFGEINAWSRAADFKASVVLAADGVILVAAAALAVGSNGFSAMLLAHHLVSLFVLLTLVSAVISSAFAALCLVPPFREAEQQSVLFMDYIARNFPDAPSYEQQVRATLTDADANLQQICHQVWSVARIFHKKVSFATWGVRFLIPALLCSLLALLLAVL
jgi:hypothetical protein